MRHILHILPSFAYGGATVRLLSLINNFDKRFTHSIFSISGDESAIDGVADPANVTFIPWFSVSSLKLHQRVRIFRKIIDEINPDLLVTYNWGAIEWAMASCFCKVPHVAVEDGFGPDEAERRLHRRNLVRRFVFQVKRSRVVAPSKTLVFVAKSEWRVPDRRLFYVPNGIDSSKYTSIDRRSRPSCFARNSSEIVIGTLAVLRPEKRLDVLIHAASKVRNGSVRLVIAGSGSEEASLRDLCKENGYGDWVDFIGYVKDPQDVLFEFDIFALSSMTEQLPLAMIEAMISSVPIVATDVGDVRASLPIEQGRWIVPFSSDALGDALSDMISDPQLRRRLGALNRLAALERFSAEPMFKAWEAIFDSV